MYTYSYEKDRNRIVAKDEAGKEVGEITYLPQDPDPIWDVTHTYVDPDYRGQDIARKLVEAIASEARQCGVKIIPTCPYTKKVLHRDPSYEDILASHSVIDKDLD